MKTCAVEWNTGTETTGCVLPAGHGGDHMDAEMNTTPKAERRFMEPPDHAALRKEWGI